MDFHALIECRGHPAISATHTKTWELTLDDDIGRRATCVLGVGGVVDWDRLLALKGPVRFTLSVGEHRDQVLAEMNPLFRAGRRLVVRTSRFRADDTLAIGADKASADLDRDLVRALAAPRARLVVDAAPELSLPRAASGVLAVVAVADGTSPEHGPGPSRQTPAAEGAGSRVAALVGRAELVLRVTAPEGRRAAPGARSGEELAGVVAGGGLACLLVADVAVPAPGLAELLQSAVDAGAELVATPGAAAIVSAVALAGPGAAAHLTVDAGSKWSATERRAMVTRTLAGPWPVVWAGPVPAVRRVADLLMAAAPDRRACTATDEGEHLARLWPCRLADVAGTLPGPRRAGSDRVLVAVGGSPADHDDARAGVQELLAALADGGVSPRTLRRALDRAPGLGSGWSYADLAGLRREGPR